MIRTPLPETAEHDLLKTTRLTDEEAGRNADSLVAFVAAGRNSLEHCPPDSLVYGKAARRLKTELKRLADESERLGLGVKLNVDTLGKMRRVAKEHTAAQISELADLVRKHRSRFSTSHLIRLLVILDRTTRDQLAATSARKSWTLATLERHIQVARQARRSGAGRHPYVPDDPLQRLIVLEGLCLKWLRWTERAAVEFPRGVRKLVADADAAIKIVQDSLANHLPRGKKPA